MEKIHESMNTYFLRYSIVMDKIKKQLLEEEKYLQSSSPYLKKLFYNMPNHHLDYVNEFGYHSPILGTLTPPKNADCPSHVTNLGNDINAFIKNGAMLGSDIRCSVYGKNVQNNNTDELAWVDIEGYKHIYTNNAWSEKDKSCDKEPLVLTHKQYTTLPTSDAMTKYKFCLTKDVDNALLYEIRGLNRDIIQYLLDEKANHPNQKKVLNSIIKNIRKQNVHLIQEMNTFQTTNAMLQDSRVKVQMEQYQYLSWGLVSILGIGLLIHFGKKK